MTDLSQRLRDLAEVLDGIEWDIPLCSKEACLEAADLIEKLPMTADSVPIVPRIKVWVLHNGKPLEVQVASIGRSVDLEDNPWGSGTMDPERWFYSTQEAAEAARSKR